jgi:hypothetical protein
MPWFRNEKVQPYRVRSARISSPGRSSVHRVDVMAPMPDEKATAASPPSRVAMRASRIDSVGFEMRV